MKKFRYNMESILKIKLKLEDQAKIAYANARNRLNSEEEKLGSLKQKKASYEQEKRDMNKRLNIMKLKQLSESIEIMKLKIIQQKIIVDAAAQRLEVARIRLNDAMVERKTQEKLKEKAWQEYMIEFEAEEQKEIDERNSFNYGSAI